MPVMPGNKQKRKILLHAVSNRQKMKWQKGTKDKVTKDKEITKEKQTTEEKELENVQKKK